MEYRVKAGDTLWSIAEYYFGNGDEQEIIKRANNLTSDSLQIDQKLIIPFIMNKVSILEHDNKLVSFEEFANAFTYNKYSVPNKHKEFLKACREANVDTKDKAAMFLAQLMYESKGLTSTNTNQNLPRALIPKEQKEYSGRGYLKLSSKQNYEEASKALGYDYVNNPSLIEQDPHAWYVTSWYWRNEVSKHVPIGFRATTQHGLRPSKPNNDARERIYFNVCIALGVKPRI